MPPPTTTQSSQKEGRIALAIDAFQQGHFTSVRSAAKAYDVPFSTLQYRVHKHPARRDSVPTNRKLITTEELTLIK
jgi:predicted HTH domain antitoxin